MVDPGLDLVAGAFSAGGTNALVFARICLGAPWKLVCPPARHAGFHIVQRGRCWLEPDDGTPALALNDGDIVLVTNGAGHVLVDAAGSTAPPLTVTELASTHAPGSTIGAGGAGRQSVLVCGGYLFEGHAQAPYIGHLPPFVRLAHESASAQTHQALALLVAELDEPRSGSSTIVNRMADILLVNVLRDWLNGLDGDHGSWLLGLSNGPIARALALLDQQPGKAWTVETLARAAALSRAAFTRQFRALTGESPRAYLTRQRMNAAARLLRETDAGLAEVGLRVAYVSEYAFNRAFCRHFGISPGRYRRQVRSDMDAQACGPHGSLTTNSQVPSG